MTFFLSQAPAPQIKARQTGLDLPNFMEGLGAGFSKSALENDANFRAGRERINEKMRAASQAATVLGRERLMEIVEERNARAREQGLNSQLIEPPETPEEFTKFYGPNFADKVLEMARNDAAENPDAWQGMDLSDEGIDARVNERLQAEHEDLETTLSMMPNGRAIAEFVGGMGGVTADVKNVPFLLMGGGGGSIMRVMGREALLNSAAEGVNLPSQFQMAERLDIPDPNIATQIAMASAAGGLLGGAVEAGARGMTYWKLRNQVKMLAPGRDEAEVTALVDEAEDILASDVPDPFGEIEALVRRNPPTPENEINPERPPLIKAETNPDAKTTAVQEREALDVEEAALPSRPLLQQFRQRGIQIDPNGPVGKELKAIGVTSRNAPGLFSKRGVGDIDNLVPDELEDVIPGITDVIGTEGKYLSRQGLIDAVSTEAQGGVLNTLARQDIATRRGSLEDRFIRGDRHDDPDSLFIDRDIYDIDPETADAQIDASVRQWMQNRGYADILSDVEQQEIVSQLQKTGGDAEYLVERALERELEYAELPPQEVRDYDEIPFGQNERGQETPVGSGRGTVETRGSDAQSEGRGDQSAAGNRGALSETTDAGEQSLIPGVRPVTQADRLSQASTAPLRGGAEPMDTGLFDLNAREQSDMFSDVSGPEARVMHDAVEADILDRIGDEDGLDVEIPLEDGRVLKTERQVLEYLGEGDAFSARIDLCGVAR